MASFSNTVWTLIQPGHLLMLLSLEDRFDQPVLSGDIDGIIVLGGG